MGAMFDYLDAEEGGAEDMIKHALGEVIELNDKICGSPGGPEKIELAARAGLQAATVLLYVGFYSFIEPCNFFKNMPPANAVFYVCFPVCFNTKMGVY